MQETESGVRLKKTMAIQARLLELLEKEVKDPLNATATFFDLVEDDHRGTAFGTEVASRARRQFHQTLTILDTLLEWGTVHQLDRRREWRETDTHRLLRRVFSKFKQRSCAQRFTLMDRHKSGGQMHPLPEEEIRFVLEMIFNWLCEIAEEGEITIEQMQVSGNQLQAALYLRSRTLFARLGQKVERFVNGRPSAETKPFPAEGFYLAMARNILEEFNGDLWVKMDAGLIEAGFELDLRNHKNY